MPSLQARCASPCLPCLSKRGWEPGDPLAFLPRGAPSSTPKGRGLGVGETQLPPLCSRNEPPPPHLDFQLSINTNK